jgi:hypothetical protein
MRHREMTTPHPGVGAPSEAMLAFVRHALGCARSCTARADTCLAEPEVEDLRQCIRLDLDCADGCGAAARLGSRRTGTNREVLAAAIDACLEACRACGDEGARHAEMHAYCRVCAGSCEAALGEV